MFSFPNQTYIDQPDNIVECWSKSKFYHQVNENFDLQYKFLDRGTAIGCNYTNYRKTVDYFKTVTKDIATMYFRCIDRDCEPAVYEGLNNWNQFVMETFYPFIVCSYTYYSPKCAQNIKHSVYFSAENLLTTLIKCSNLKRTSQRPDSRLLLKEIFYKKSFECNCVKMVSLKLFFNIENVGNVTVNDSRMKDRFLSAKNSATRQNIFRR